MSRMKSFLAACLAASALCLPGLAQASLVWNESSAGDLPGTAESTLGGGPQALTGISGFLTASVPVGGNPLYQVDLYQILITDAASFSARTRDTQLDTALFLFDSAGRGVFMNDDLPDFSGLTSLLPAGDANGPVGPGIYYLAVALGTYVAEDGGPADIFLPGGFNDVRGGDPAAGALAGWRGFDAFSESPLEYFIELTGVSTAEIPEPGTAALMLAAGLGLWASRRRAPTASRRLAVPA